MQIYMRTTIEVELFDGDKFLERWSFPQTPWGPGILEMEPKKSPETPAVFTAPRFGLARPLIEAGTGEEDQELFT